jgi:hypothetical protein
MKYNLTTKDNGEFLVVMQGDDIIAHLPLKETKTIEGVDLLPPLPQGEDIERLAIDYVNLHYRVNNYYAPLSFVAGYNIAKETYKYTEEDVRKAIMFGCYQQKNYNCIINTEEIDFIQSLQQQPKIPIAFECETETPFVDGFTEDRVRRFYGNPEPKTITNSQGQTEWVGKYIYE